MDKTVFIKQSFKEAADHQSYYKSLNEEARGKVFFALMQAAYGFVGEGYPKMEKVFTSSRKHHCE